MRAGSKERKWGLLVVAMLLTACGPESLPEGETGVPTVARISLPASTPSRTPSLVPTPTLLAPTETDDGSSPYLATATAIVEAVKATGQPRSDASHISPDGKWQTEIVIYDCVQIGEAESNAYEQLVLVDLEEGVERFVDDQRRNRRWWPRGPLLVTE